MAYSYSTIPILLNSDKLSIKNIVTENLTCENLTCENIDGIENNTFFFTNTTALSPFQSSFTLNYKKIGDLIIFSIPTITEISAQTSQKIEYRPLLPVNLRPQFSKHFIIPIINTLSLYPKTYGMLTIDTTGALYIEGLDTTTFSSGLYGGFMAGTYTYDLLK